MKLESAHLIMPAAYSLAMVAIAPTEIHDWQALVIALSSGAMGGFIAAVFSKAAIPDWKAFLARVVASAMAAPALVLLWLLWKAGEGEMVLYLFPTVAASLVLGLIAWPVASLVLNTKPAEIKEWIIAAGKRVFGGPS